jgi:hypothetical protein
MKESVLQAARQRFIDDHMTVRMQQKLTHLARPVQKEVPDIPFLLSAR